MVTAPEVQDPKVIPTARQEIEEHLITLAGEEAKVRNKMSSLTAALAVADQQLAGLMRLQEDYRLALTVLPNDDRGSIRLTTDWLVPEASRTTTPPKK